MGSNEGKRENTETQTPLLSILANVMYPHFCKEIGCPVFSRKRCESCRLKDLLAEKEASVIKEPD